MHRVALFGLLLSATACSTQDMSAHDPSPSNFEGTGFAKFLDDTHTFASGPNLPEGTALNVLRVESVPAPVEPLTTETGTIWPGPPEPVKSLRDLQLESDPLIAPEPRMPTARQLGDNGGRAYVPAPKATPSVAPSSAPYATPNPASEDTVLTNADGSQTIIRRDGKVEFKPAPK